MNDSFLALNSEIPEWLLIILLTIAMAVSLWLEWKRKSPFLIIRLFAILLIAAGLLGIFTQPAMRMRDARIEILLTENYDEKKLDSLLTAYPQASQVASTGHARTSGKRKTLADDHNIDYVIGNGLARAELDLLRADSFVYIPNSLPYGIVQLNLPKNIFSNRINEISGVFNNRSTSTLILASPGGKEDSVSLVHKGLQNFTLQFNPKHAGNFYYVLSDGKNAHDTLAISVNHGTKLNILLIQHYPTFESRYLKTYLTRNHAVATRYQVSQNKFNTEFINQENASVGKLSDKLLSQIDLLILDSDAIKQLPSTELYSIQRAVQEGLGVLILFNSLPEKNKIAGNLLDVSFSKIKNDTAHLLLDQKKVTLPALPVNPATTSNFVFQMGNKTRVLNAVVSKGRGKVGFQLLQATYQLQLRGDSGLYARVWSALIEQTSRTRNEKFSIDFPETTPIFPDEPIEFRILSDGTTPKVYYDSIRVPVKEDLFIDDVWNCKIWAGRPGWHSITIEGDSKPYAFYVSTENSWKALSTANMIRDTKLKSSATLRHKREMYSYRPISKLLFYLLVILGATTLWLMPKL